MQFCLVPCIVLAALATMSMPARAQKLDTSWDYWQQTLSRWQNLQWWDEKTRYGAQRVSDAKRPNGTGGGFRVGRFNFASSINSRLVYDDNVFFERRKRGDFYAEVAPTLSMTTETARHYFNVTAEARAYKYAKYDELDALDREIAVSGALHINSAHLIYGSVSWGLHHENHTSRLFPSGDNPPVADVIENHERTPVHSVRGNLVLKRDAGRLHGSLRAKAGRWDYHDATAPDGSEVDQDYRDAQVIGGEARVGYRFSPGYEVHVQARTERLDFLHDSGRFANGWSHEVAAGVNLETSPLLRWQFSGGYGHRTFDDASNQDTGSYLIKGSVDWLVTPRLTIRADAERRLLTVSKPDRVFASISNSLRLNADFDLYRNVVFTINGEYRNLKEVGGSIRTDMYKAGASLNYFSTKNWVASIGYDHVARDSNDPALAATRNEFWGRVKFQF